LHVGAERDVGRRALPARNRIQALIAQAEGGQTGPGAHSRSRVSQGNGHAAASSAMIRTCR
jgi:hypothetical protein